MSPAEALAETEQMTATSVSAALSAMKPWQAADIVQVDYQSDFVPFLEETSSLLAKAILLLLYHTAV